MNINEKILIMGAGVTGKAALEALLPHAKQLALYDEADEALLAPVREAFSSVQVYRSVETVPLENFDLILKSPGIDPGHSLLRVAREKNIPVWSDAELAYRLFPDRTILGITGTNGKTTTTALLCHIAGSERMVHCLGNIGVGVLPAFFSGRPDDIYILELSSFQLTHSPSLRTSICGVLNLSPDHLNWHGSMDSYVQAKTNLVLNQKETDLCVLNMDDPILEELAKKTVSKVIPVSLEKEVPGYYKKDGMLMRGDEDFFDFSELQIPGVHNQQNVLVAVAMAVSLGISDQAVRNGLRTFPGVAHRIEYIGQKDGVRFYNDSKGTNVDASIKAIEALPGPIRLLAGGMDKKVSYAPLIEKLEGKVVKLYLYGETARLLQETAQTHGFTEAEIFPDLSGATETAFKESRPGDMVLLSPASASWDMYPNFETRGEHFRSIANEMGITHETQTR